MNPRVLLLIIGLLLFPLGCGGDDDPTDPAVPRVLEPSEFCSDHPYATIATFEDANLEAAIRAALSVGAQEGLIAPVRCHGYLPVGHPSRMLGPATLRPDWANRRARSRPGAFHVSDNGPRAARR